MWWVLGTAFLALVAWLTANWMTYHLVLTIFSVAIIPFYWLSPESPRLRLTQNRVQEADQIIRKIKKVNGDEIPEDLTDQLEEIAAEISHEKAAGVMCLITSKKMAIITFLFCLTW